jgi:ankyrin repeat protein
MSQTQSEAARLKLICHLQQTLMDLTPYNIGNVFVRFLDGPDRIFTKDPRLLMDLCQCLFLVSELRHNDLQTLVDFTEMLYSARGEPGRCLDEIRWTFLKKFQIVCSRPPGRASSNFAFFRYLYLCLTQFLCTRREIVKTIQNFADKNPGLRQQIAFMSLWFLSDIKRYNPGFFEKVCTIISGQNFVESAIPEWRNFSDLDWLNERIYCVFEPGSVGDAIRTDDVSRLAMLSNETSFNPMETLPDSLYGCYLLWKDSLPNLLEASAFFGSVKIFKYFVVNGILPTEPGPQKSLVRWACAGGNLEIIRFLEASGFDIKLGMPIVLQYQNTAVLNWMIHRFCRALAGHTFDELEESLRSELWQRAVAGENVGFLIEFAAPTPQRSSLFRLSASLGRPFAFKILYEDSEGEDICQAVIEGGSVDVLKICRNAKFYHTNKTMLLNLACENGLLDMAELLICDNADVNQRFGPKKIVPMISASLGGHAEVVRFLIQAGGNCNYLCPGLNSAFDYAVLGGHVETVKVFLEQERLPKHTIPLLTSAVTRRHLDVVRVLANDPRIAFGEDTLARAASSGGADAIELLLSRVGSCDRSQLGFALHAAVKGGQVPSVAALLKIDSSIINGMNNDGYSALHYAALTGAVPIVKLMLEYSRIMVNTRNADGQTPLHFAAENGHLKCAELLLSHPDIEVNTEDRKGCTALHIAVLHNQREVVRKLLETPGIRVNHRNGRGLSALHIACEHGFYESVCLLVRFPGVKLLKTTRLGWTNLHLAARNGHDDVLSLLVPRCKEVLNAKTQGGYTALHFACIGKHTEGLRVLVEEDGIDANLQTDANLGGKTCLHFAAAYGFVDGVKMLLNSRRVNAEIESAAGAKAVDLARKYNRVAVVRLFDGPAL